MSTNSRLLRSQTTTTYQPLSPVYRPASKFYSITSLRLLFIAVTVLIILCVLYDYLINKNISFGWLVYRSTKNTSSEKESATVSRTKIQKPPLILAWTKLFSGSLADETYINLQHCNYRCTVTDDRRVETSADALVLHGRNVDTNKDLPKNRSSNQLYVFLLQESPHHTGNVLEIVPKDFFNLTMTYRRDSDVFAPYGVLKKIDNDTKEDQIWDWNEVKEIAESKTEMLLQFVSNCRTPSKREKYVEKLKLFINITQRGSCNKVKCDEGCAANLTAVHRFYLAFENSVCRDYVTEKAFRSMRNLIVPIVLKKSIYHDILPAGSFIAVDDFASPRELADYLKYLESNTTAYLSYLEWTKHYQKSNEFDGYCELCKYLNQHTNDIRPKVLRDIKSWWYDGGQCIRDYALQFISKHKTFPKIASGT